MKAGRLAIAAMLVFAFVAISLTIYVGGYLWLGEETHTSSMHDAMVDGARVWVDDGLTIERAYRQQWQMHVFQPVAAVEAQLRGCNVRVSYRNPKLD